MTGDPIQPDLQSSANESSNVVSLPLDAVFHAPLIKPIWRRIAWQKIALFSISVFLFISAITFMKEGARGLAPFVQNQLTVDNAFNSLGFGWLFAYVVMSGSPVAASALTFFDAGIFDKTAAFTMITGSRMGASFIVLFIGFLYVLRGRNRTESLGIGLLSLGVTGTTYTIALALGFFFISTGLLDHWQMRSGVLLNSLTDLIFDPMARFLLSILPQWSLFVVGLAVILLSFSLFDRCLPEMTLKKSQVGRMSRLVYLPWVMFLLGGLITLVSMSVTVSLGILVPLSARGFVRRENLIPYIMGANITTFIDTLLAAVMLRNPAAFTIVMVEMVSIAIVSIVLLATIYRHYEHSMLAFVNWLTNSNRNLGLFMLILFIVPLVLMLV